MNLDKCILMCNPNPYQDSDYITITSENSLMHLSLSIHIPTPYTHRDSQCSNLKNPFQNFIELE